MPRAPTNTGNVAEFSRKSSGWYFHWCKKCYRKQRIQGDFPTAPHFWNTHVNNIGLCKCNPGEWRVSAHATLALTTQGTNLTISSAVFTRGKNKPLRLFKGSPVGNHKDGFRWKSYFEIFWEFDFVLFCLHLAVNLGKVKIKKMSVEIQTFD